MTDTNQTPATPEEADVLIVGDGPGGARAGPGSRHAARRIRSA